MDAYGAGALASLTVRGAHCIAARCTRNLAGRLPYLHNAVKYAYPPPQRGEIAVRFRADPECVLEVGDSGAGLPNGVVNSTIGLGMKLVTSLVQQAGGELSVKHHPGVTYTIRFAATAENQGGGAPA